MTRFQERQDLVQRDTADEIDRAQNLTMEANLNSVREIQNKCKPVRLPRADGTYENEDCDDCGNEIGIDRMRVAIRNNLCVFCLTKRERFQR